MNIALIFSEPVSSSFVRMFCTPFGDKPFLIKAIYLNGGKLSARTDEMEDDKHCFDYAKRNKFIPIYITIL